MRKSWRKSRGETTSFSPSTVPLYLPISSQYRVALLPTSQPIPTPCLIPLVAPLVAAFSIAPFAVVSWSLSVARVPWLGCCRKGGDIRHQSLRGRWARDFYSLSRDFFFHELQCSRLLDVYSICSRWHACVFSSLIVIGSNRMLDPRDIDRGGNSISIRVSENRAHVTVAW